MDQLNKSGNWVIRLNNFTKKKHTKNLRWLQMQKASMKLISKLFISPHRKMICRVVKESIIEPQVTGEVDLFACPVCFEPLIRKGPPVFNLSAINRSGFKCAKCNKSYSRKNIYLDLTVIAGAKEYVEAQPSRTELFRYGFVVTSLTGQAHKVNKLA